MDLSIIVPIYNMELYLEKCLLSLVNQRNNIYSYEVICINDGSTDNSQEILNDYKSKYSDIINVIVTENLGVSNARNVGIESSKGDYITFVDSDDWVSENFVEESLKNIKGSNLDLVVFDTIYMYQEAVYHPEKITDTIFNTENHACGKVFRKDLINKYKIKFPVGISIGEDLTFTFSYICVHENYKHVPKGVYYYRQSREGSAMTSDIRHKYKEVNEACRLVHKFAKDNDLLEKKYKEIEYLFVKNIIVRSTMKIIRNNRSVFKIWNEIKEQTNFVDEIFKGWKENIYVLNDSDRYLSSKLGEKYMGVLNNIDCSIAKVIWNFVMGKLLYKGEKNEYEK